MAKFCRYVATFLFIGAIIVVCVVNLISGLMIAPSIIIFLVIADHLDNQKEIIEAVKAAACPQLFYITTFAPDLIRYFLSINAPEYADTDVKFQPPVFATDGSFIIKGYTFQHFRPKNFEMAFMPGQSFHRINDWRLTYFKWI